MFEVRQGIHNKNQYLIIEAQVEMVRRMMTQYSRQDLVNQFSRC